MGDNIILCSDFTAVRRYVPLGNMVTNVKVSAHASIMQHAPILMVVATVQQVGR